ncbi:MAG: TldD/PmbA family protein [Myxococcota bacterium]|nr:TldD/PmbA family protein [Myxococcota bacterium]
MWPSRRAFLAAGGAGAALAMEAALRGRLAEARGLLVDSLLAEVTGRALDAARRAGCSYADVRVVRRRSERISARESRIDEIHLREDYGLGVRVLHGGAWGFAATARVLPQEAARVATQAVEVARAGQAALRRPVQLAANPPHVDVWQTPLSKDPFRIPLQDKADLLLAINAEAMKVPGIAFCTSHYAGLSEWKLFRSSEGADIEQSITRVGPGYRVTAVDRRSGEFETRDHDLPPMQAGWEYVVEAPLLRDARRIGEEALEKLRAPSVTPGVRDLVLHPSHLWLTIHESVGHPTELDRALGYEANFAGTSFATPDQLGRLQFAAPLVTLYADKTTPGGLATCGYDDEGVKTQRWDLVRNGLFVAYQTTREQAGWIGEQASRGTSYAQDHRSIPIQRMPNVSLAPGERELGVQDLISATEDGIYIVGHGSFSIDHQRHNFQFGGQMFYEIKKGRIVRTLRDVAYQASTLQFWRSCDLLGGPASWQLHGSLFDGKGEPGQANAVSHGCPPARFRRVNVLSTNRRRG